MRLSGYRSDYDTHLPRGVPGYRSYYARQPDRPTARQGGFSELSVNPLDTPRGMIKP